MNYKKFFKRYAKVEGELYQSVCTDEEERFLAYKQRMEAEKISDENVRRQLEGLSPPTQGGEE